MEQKTPIPLPPPPNAAQKPKRAIFRQLSVKIWADLLNRFGEI